MNYIVKKGDFILREKEPYIGMPIYLDDCDCDDFMEDDVKEHNCGSDDCLSTWPLAMAYVPWQPWEKTYDQCKGLQVGTIFPSLNLPFLGGGKR